MQIRLAKPNPTFQATNMLGVSKYFLCGVYIIKNLYVDTVDSGKLYCSNLLNLLLTFFFLDPCFTDLFPSPLSGAHGKRPCSLLWKWVGGDNRSSCIINEGCLLWMCKLPSALVRICATEADNAIAEAGIGQPGTSLSRAAQLKLNRRRPCVGQQHS